MSVSNSVVSGEPITRAKLKKADISLYSDCLSKYDEKLRLRTDSQSTITNYLADAKIFFAWCVLMYGQIPFANHPDHVCAFLTYLRVDEKLADATIAAYRSAILALYHYVLGVDLSPWDVPITRKDSKLPLVPTKAEVLSIYDACDTPLRKALFLLLVNTGGRISEIASLHFEDIHRKTMQCYFAPSKGRKDRYVPIGNDLLEGITDHCMAFRSLYGHYPKPGDYIFTKPNGLPMTTANLRAELVAILKRANLYDKGYRCHSFRHFYALMMYTSETSAYYHDLVSISALLGHKTLTPTLVYLRLAQVFSPKEKGEIPSPMDMLLAERK